MVASGRRPAGDAMGGDTLVEKKASGAMGGPRNVGTSDSRRTQMAAHNEGHLGAVGHLIGGSGIGQSAVGQKRGEREAERQRHRSVSMYQTV